MPIYEYKCEECGQQIEAIQKFSDDPLTECPNCKKQALKKMLSASAFHLKGSGWYQTDFKNSSCKSDDKASSCSTCTTGDASK
jgi:putative FmdB family regulatory protein